MSAVSLNIPGLLYISPAAGSELSVVHVGPAVGWVAHQGIHTWSREVSVALKADLKPALLRELGGALPEEHPEAARLTRAARAAKASSYVAVDGRLVDKLTAKGVRVHTIGADRITGGFYYFAVGGTGTPVRFQANLIEMIAPSLGEKSDNDAIEASLDGIVGRVLAAMAEGGLTEPAIELAAALPAVGEAKEAGAAKLQELEGRLLMAETRASKYEASARAVVEALGAAARKTDEKVRVPLFGEARRVVQQELVIEYADGDAGTSKRMTLPERTRWFVAELVEEDGVRVDKAAAEKAAAEKAAAEKAAAQKAAAEKAAAEKAAAEKRAAEKAAAEKAAAEKAAALKAAAEKAAADKAAAAQRAAEKAAAEKAAAEKAAAAKAAAERAAAEKAAAEKAAAEKAAAEKAAAEKATAEQAAAEKAAAEKAAAEKAEAEKVAAEKAAAEKAAARKAQEDRAAASERKVAAEKKATSEKKKAADKAAREAPTARKKAAARTSDRAPAAKAKQASAAKKNEKAAAAAASPSKPSAMWAVVLVILAAAGAAYYYFQVMHHG